MFTTIFFIFLLFIFAIIGLSFGLFVKFLPYIILALAVILIVKWVKAREGTSQKELMQDEIDNLRQEMMQMQAGQYKSEGDIKENDEIDDSIDDAEMQPVMKSEITAAPEIIMDYTPPPPKKKPTSKEAAKKETTKPNPTIKETPPPTPTITPPPEPLPYENYKLSSFELPKDFEWDRWACWKALISYTFSKDGIKEIASSSLEAILGGKFFSWLGRIALTLGAIFFLGYLFTIITIPPSIFIPIAAAIGAGFLGLGFFLHKRWAKFAGFLGSLGIITLYASIFAAASDRFEHLIPDQIGFIFAFGISLIALYPAARLSKYMPLLGAIGAYVTPLIGNVGNLNFMLAYLSSLTVIFIIYGLRRKLIEPLIGCGLGSIGWVYYLLETTQFLPTHNLLEGNLLALYFITSNLALLYAAHKIVITTSLKSREDLAAWPIWALAILSMGVIARSTHYFDYNFTFCLAPAFIALGFGFFTKLHPRIQHVFTLWCIFFLALPFWQVNIMTASTPYFALKITLIYLPMLVYTSWHSNSQNNVWPHGITAAGIGLLAYYANYFSMTDARSIFNHNANQAVAAWERLDPLILKTISPPIPPIPPISPLIYSDTFWALLGLALTFLFGLMTYSAYKRAKNIGLKTNKDGSKEITQTQITERMNALSLSNIFGITSILIGLNAIYLAADIDNLTLIFAILALAFTALDLYLGKIRKLDTEWARYGATIMAVFASIAFIVTSPADLMPYRINGFSWATVFLGIPALCFAISSHLLSKSKIDNPVHVLDIITTIFALTWIVQDIALLRESANWIGNIGDLKQAAWTITSCLTLAALQITLFRQSSKKRTMLLYSSIAISSIAIIGVSFISFIIFDSPYRIISGGIFNNTLIPALLLPAILFTIIGWKHRSSGNHKYGYAQYIIAYISSMFYVTYEAMYVYHEAPIEILNFGYTLVSLSWVVYALFLMALALTLKNRAFRLASLATMLMACAKVFIMDMAALEGLARAASFLGLGASLMLIGWLYQNIITIENDDESKDDESKDDEKTKTEEPEKTKP